MKYFHLHNNGRYNLLYFSTFIAVEILCAYLISTSFEFSGIWHRHAVAGNHFLNNEIPELHSYPMWGLSFLVAGLGKPAALGVQAIVTLFICIFWYSTILNQVGNIKNSKYIRYLKSGPLVAIMMFPFIMITISEHANSFVCLLTLLGWSLLSLLRSNNLKGVKYYILSGVLFGIAYNFRAEALLLIVLMFMAILLSGLLENRLKTFTSKGSIFLFSALIMTLPWLTYTGTVGKSIQLSSTNGGAVMYLGLGYLPNNPWGIVADDRFVAKIAEDNGFISPWSESANIYFTEQYINAVVSEPASFIYRVIHGWKLMFMQGIELPNMRRLFSQGGHDFEVIDFLNENIKKSLGLSVNIKELNSYHEKGINNQDIMSKHYLIVLTEYSLRLIYAMLFLSLVLMAVYLSIKDRFNSFTSLSFIGYFAFSLLIAGFIQTLPRHTTILLPILISTIVILDAKFNSKNLSNEIVKGQQR